MKLNRVYHLIVNDVVYATSSNLNEILKLFDKIKKSERNAYICTYYN